jgi:uncharacterized membrane protein
MTRTWLLKILVGLLFFLYPVFIYFGLKEFQPQLLAVYLLAIALLRLAVWRGRKVITPYWIVVPLIVVVVTVVTGSNFGLFLYPALVNLVFFSFFAISLFYPPTIVERFARYNEPQLPAEAISYTRKVTKVWCLFFLINGSLSLISLRMSEQWWLIYNGLIAYILMGALFAVEYLIRRRVMSKHHA